LQFVELPLVSVSATELADYIAYGTNFKI
jgi:hypothetical protein